MSDSREQPSSLDPTKTKPRGIHGKARPRGLGAYGKPLYNQATKIIAKFGGEAAFARILGVNRITAYRYNYSRPYGRDGLIPVGMVERVQTAARHEGILLTEKDWAPERVIYTKEEE